jgi:hypothetical protein
MVKDPLDPITQDWNLFTTSLRTLYGAHDTENTAVVAIEALSMRDNTTVTQYIVEFQTHAPYTGWNDAALKAMFWKHLLERIKSAFLTIGKPATFDLMIEAVLNVDQNYWSAQAEKGIKPKLKSANEKFNSQRKSDSANTNHHGNNPQNSNTNRNQQRPNQQPSANTQKNSGKTPEASGGTVRGDRYQVKKRSVANAKGFASIARPMNTLDSTARIACLTKSTSRVATNTRIPPGLVVNQVKSLLAEIPPWPAMRSTLLKPTQATRETPRQLSRKWRPTESGMCLPYTLSFNFFFVFNLRLFSVSFSSSFITLSLTSFFF